jgi:hypothetical protein
MEVDESNPQGRIRIVQSPVYYISEVLHDAKTRYLEVDKLLYAILIASRKLRHYFQAHKISVVTSYPLRVVLPNPNVNGNIAKWAAELAEFELDFVAMRLRVKCSLILWRIGRRHQVTQGGQTAVRRSRQLRCSPAFTGPSSSTAPRVSRGPVREPCSLLQTRNNSSTWCTLSLKQPTTWQNTRRSSSG